MTNERDLTEDDVREEHLAAIDQGVQALYITGVILGGLVLMILIIAVLGGAGA